MKDAKLWKQRDAKNENMKVQRTWEFWEFSLLEYFAEQVLLSNKKLNLLIFGVSRN